MLVRDQMSIAVLGSSVGFIPGALSSAKLLRAGRYIQLAIWSFLLEARTSCRLVGPTLSGPQEHPAKNSNMFRTSFAMLTGLVLAAKLAVDPMMVLGFEEHYSFSIFHTKS